jgi:hypothetical protein
VTSAKKTTLLAVCDDLDSIAEDLFVASEAVRGKTALEGCLFRLVLRLKEVRTQLDTIRARPHAPEARQ